VQLWSLFCLIEQVFQFTTQNALAGEIFEGGLNGISFALFSLCLFIAWKRASRCLRFVIKKEKREGFRSLMCRTVTIFFVLTVLFKE
jgi:hypothetical protein